MKTSFAIFIAINTLGLIAMENGEKNAINDEEFWIAASHYKLLTEVREDPPRSINGIALYVEKIENMLSAPDVKREALEILVRPYSVEPYSLGSLFNDFLLFNKNTSAGILFEQFKEVQTWENARKLASCGPITPEIATCIFNLTRFNWLELKSQNTCYFPVEMLLHGNYQLFLTVAYEAFEQENMLQNYFEGSSPSLHELCVVVMALRSLWYRLYIKHAGKELFGNNLFSANKDKKTGFTIDSALTVIDEWHAKYQEFLCSNASEQEATGKTELATDEAGQDFKLLLEMAHKGGSSQEIEDGIRKLTIYQSFLEDLGVELSMHDLHTQAQCISFDPHLATDKELFRQAMDALAALTANSPSRHSESPEKLHCVIL